VTKEAEKADAKDGAEAYAAAKERVKRLELEHELAEAEVQLARAKALSKTGSELDLEAYEKAAEKARSKVEMRP
jgi:hypothetical protein